MQKKQGSVTCTGKGQATESESPDLNLTEKDFKRVITNMFKEQKETRLRGAQGEGR